MKIRTCRYSGLPVDVSSMKAFDEEFKAGYDAAEAKNTLDTRTPEQLAEGGETALKFKPLNMEAMQKDLAALDETLRLKYKVEGEDTLPKTLKAWNDLIKKYEAPIMIANSASNPEELVLVIVDVPLG